MIKNIEKLIREDKVLSSRDKKKIISFITYVSPELSIKRIKKYGYVLRLFKKYLKVDYLSATEKDIRRAVAELNNTDYAEKTKADVKVCIKRFFKWLKGSDKFYPSHVNWIKTTVKKNFRKLPEDLLTEEDIQKLISVCDNLRDKAIVMTLYESGCRIGEFIELKKKDVSFDEDGVLLTIPKGKTGARRIRLVASSSYLAEWINNSIREKESYLWIGLNNKKKNEKIGQNAVRIILKYLKNKSGIDKPVNPHHFRHSRATFLANKLTEAQMCAYFGWVLGSDMPSTYVHLSQRDVDDAILGIYGHKEKREIKSKLTPISCPKCKRKLPSGSNLCSFCGTPINKEGEDIRTRDKDLASKSFIELCKQFGIKGNFEIKE